MTATNKLLIPAADLPAVSTLLYTSPAAGKGAYIDKITACNHSGATQSVTFNHVQPAGSAAGSNLIVTAQSIASGATDGVIALQAKFMPPGAQLFGQCSAASSVSFEMNGRELT